MNIQHLVIFCIAQTLGLIIILLQKKFRTLPNFMLVSILCVIEMHYVYYYFYYTEVISLGLGVVFLILMLSASAPSLVYFYVVTVLYGCLKANKFTVLHALPMFIICGLWAVFYMSDGQSQLLVYLAKCIVLILYLIYPILILKTLGKFYDLKHFTLKVFKYHKKKTALVKLLLYMMMTHFIILFIKVYVNVFIKDSLITMDYVNVVFLMVLGYALSYIIISEPRSISLAGERTGLSGFKKYEKSSLTRAKAKENLTSLNELMEGDKPYLNSDFNLHSFSSLSGLPSHIISETLNGLIGQTFHDYVNNYRVEEFKKLIFEDHCKHFTILAIAFEAGFKSKATFNTAFKKIVKVTPS